MTVSVNTAVLTTREASKRIRQLREAMSMSRPQFADLMGVPPTTLKNYELGYREVGGLFLINVGHRLGNQALLWVTGMTEVEDREQFGGDIRAALTAKGMKLKSYDRNPK